MTMTATEAAAYEAYKEVLEAAYQSGGLASVMHFSKEAVRLADFAAMKAEQDGLKERGTATAVAKILTDWSPGMLRHLAELAAVAEQK